MNGFGRGLIGLGCLVVLLGSVHDSDAQQAAPAASFGVLEYLPTRGLPFTRHAGNGEVLSGGLGSQGTQFDALGHFGFLDTAWPGTEPFPAEQVRYYNGFTQAQVKPAADGAMQKLGVDKAAPIVTSAVMLDAVAYRGRRLNPGELAARTVVLVALDNPFTDPDRAACRKAWASPVRPIAIGVPRH